MKIIIAIAFLSLIASSHSIDAAFRKERKGNNGDAAGRSILRKQLFRNYDKQNVPDDVTVNLGLSIITLDVFEEQGVISIASWLKYHWIDSRLRWDNGTNQINVMRIGPDEIWKPDITLYNNANTNKDMMNCWESNAIVYPNGEIMWIPTCQLHSFCNLTLGSHPFGEQSCELKFGSWTYDSDLLDIDYYYGKKTADLSEYNGRLWKITGTSALRNEKIYPCCPESYTDITYTLKFEREGQNSCKAE